MLKLKPVFRRTFPAQFDAQRAHPAGIGAELSVGLNAGPFSAVTNHAAAFGDDVAFSVSCAEQAGTGLRSRSAGLSIVEEDAFAGIERNHRHFRLASDGRGITTKGVVGEGPW